MKNIGLGDKKMGPKRDPPRPLGVKHRGIASQKEQGFALVATRLS
jgi:hypothetical protein